MADKAHITPQDYVTRLVQVGFWATPENPIQYAFLLQRPAYLPNEPGWTVLTAVQRAAVERAFAMVAEVVNLTFVEVPDNQQQPGVNNPRINFYANSVDLSFSGSMSSYQFAGSDAIHGADIRFNTARIAQRQNNEGFQDFTSFVVLHEVLHAMGLSHPGNYNGQGPTYQNDAEFAEDTVQYSVMSYFAAANTGANHFIGSVLYAGRTPLLYDILALQSLYAPNMSTRAGDTVYGFNSNTGATSPFNFAVTTGPVVAIWDGGGTDTIDLSGYSSASLINLNAGEFSDAGGLTKNIAIAFGVTIENAIGGAGNDQLIGNAAANVLTGGGGADVLTGGAGNDTYNVDSADTIVEAAGGGFDTVVAGFSYVLGAELEGLTLTGTGAIDGTGNGLGNVLRGNAAANRLRGGAGDDQLIGGGGEDTAVYAGNRADYLIDYSNGLTVRDLNASDGDEGTDTLTEIRFIQFVDATVDSTIPPNHPPVLGNPAMADQTWPDSTPAGYAIPNSAFVDVDGQNTLTFTARLSNGSPLPAWLGFDPATRTFTGTPPVGAIGTTLEIRVTATDSGGIAISDDFLIAVSQAPGADVLGTLGPDILEGTFRNELLFGNDGDDVLRGSAGADSMNGGAGTDLADYALSPSAVLVDLGSGTAEGGHAQGDSLVAVEGVRGSAFDDRLIGGTGGNRLEGGGGADRMEGGLGDDIYVVDNSGDAVIEAADAGLDLVESAVTAWLPANVEFLLLTGGGAIDGTGNALANRLTGNGSANLLDGGEGADLLIGGGGNDVYLVDNAADSVVELAGGGDDEVRTALAVYSLAGADNVERLTGTSGAGQQLTGNGLANVIIAGSGNDLVDGGAGADVLRGALGNDVYVVDNAGDNLDEVADGGTDEVRTSLSSFSLLNLTYFENLSGTSNAGQTLEGNGLANFILGGSGNDVIDGGGGADVLRGALGNDVYVVDNAGDNLDEAADGGTDEVRTGLASFSLFNLTHFENLIGTSNSGQTLEGNGLANFILGGSGNDVIDGGAGADVLRGALGNDVYIVDDAGDNLDEVADGGTDEVRTSLAAFSLFNLTHFENLTGTSNAGQILEGNGLSNFILGGSGDDLLIGGAGADVLRGALGNDIYVVDDDTDNLDEVAGGGTDEIRTSLAWFSLANLPNFANFENVTGTGAVDQSLTGNALDNVIDGGLGADAMAGGAGNDVYFVDNVGDSVSELLFEGTDEVRTGLATYVLGANVENLTATSNVNHDLRGNGGDNVIVGGTGNDTFRMQDGGTDSAIGGDGNDFFLFGSSLTSADSVNGGAGVDQVAIQGDYNLTFGTGFVNIESLIPLPGNDTRFGDSGGNFYAYNLTAVDANLSAGQRLTVDANRLRVGEDFSFNGTAETDGNFFLVGGHGVDTFTGGLQNDTFLFGENGQFGASDTVNGGPAGNNDQLALRGNYTVTFGAGQMTGVEAIVLVSAQDTRFGPLGSVYNYNLTMHDSNATAGLLFTIDGGNLRGGETLTVDASAESDASYRIAGGAGADTITGGQQGDLLIGRIGADTLRGGAGNDIFRIDSTTESNASGRDSILDFAGGDRIDLSRMDANSGAAGDQAFTFIGSAAFSNAAGQLRFESAGGNNWLIQGDVDGNGIADFEVAVTIDDLHPITAADFIL